MAEEVEVAPDVGAPALLTAENSAIESAGFSNRIAWERQMEGLDDPRLLALILGGRFLNSLRLFGHRLLGLGLDLACLLGRRCFLCHCLLFV